MKRRPGGLYAEIMEVMACTARSYGKLRALQKSDLHVCAIQFGRNF
jgi:hypothetical protein